MKSVIPFFILCLIATQFIACKKETTNPSTPLLVTAASVAGNFTVGSFVSTGSETSTFSSFLFTFKEDGTIVATKGSDTFDGTWKFDDGNNTEIKINFSAFPLSQLNGSWYVEDLTDDHLYLKDSSEADDNDDDHPSTHSRLEFERA
ncbi:hypothetical protein FC093_02380 [Ilyomonas limi]|uniref:Lipocalin-like domain-containing protein n=1 Tax=Ilyomonas limi TaxID=2575867 RepID=A0A4U3LBJ8_9BACT|nr:hypothetical protein [Ilyomonas limi]TKK71884.1 hypothetical protein FC093_02380 [Ilyomonas limi]